MSTAFAATHRPDPHHRPRHAGQVPGAHVPAAAMALAALLAVPTACAAGDVSPVHGYYHFVHWVSMGRSDLALQQFTDDAIVVAGPGCTRQAPCVGKVAIGERYLAALKTGRSALPLQDARFDGRTLRTHGEAIVQEAADGSFVRLRGGHRFEFRDGRISSLQVRLDLDDPATAAFVARHETLASIPTEP